MIENFKGEIYDVIRMFDSTVDNIIDIIHFDLGSELFIYRIFLGFVILLIVVTEGIINIKIRTSL
jgi:hypothetical protein